MSADAGTSERSEQVGVPGGALLRARSGDAGATSSASTRGATTAPSPASELAPGRPASGPSTVGESIPVAPTRPGRLTSDSWTSEYLQA